MQKGFIVDVWLGSKYASHPYRLINQFRASVLNIARLSQVHCGFWSIVLENKEINGNNNMRWVTHFWPMFCFLYPLRNTRKGRGLFRKVSSKRSHVIWNKITPCKQCIITEHLASSSLIIAVLFCSVFVWEDWPERRGWTGKAQNFCDFSTIHDWLWNFRFSPKFLDNLHAQVGIKRITSKWVNSPNP